MHNIDYTPPLSLVPFFTSDKFVNIVMGPIGSGKTTASLLKLAYEAKRIAPCKDGVRRSRTVVVRSTREQLRDTTIKDFMAWYPEGSAGSFLKTENRFMLRFDDVEAEVLFRALDEAADVRKLLSLQLTWAIVDEIRELNQQVFDQLQGRLGRYPSKVDNGVGACDETGKTIDKLWSATNPPDRDSWLETYMSNPPENASIHFQPSGLSPEADWLQYLKEDYYPNLCEGKSDSWINIYVKNNFGDSLSGKPVFGSFKESFHVAKNPLTHIKSNLKPLMIGLDFGLSPAATICQLDMMGRLLILAAITSEGYGIARFIQEKLKPLLVERFPGHPVLVIGDPAGAQRAQTDERSCFDILKNEGFRCIPARTNAVQARISAVERFLSRQVDGGPGFLVDPEHAKAIINALRGGYRYKIKKSGEMEDAPDKNSHSHVADSLQYACLHADGGAMFGSSFGQARREVKSVRAGGWT